MGKAIGIDLGTTNSVACYFDGNTTRILVNASNEELTPSVVSVQKFEDEEPEILIGRPAVTQAKLSPEDTIFSIKRLIGRPFHHDDVQKWKDKVSYAVTESKEPAGGLAAVVMGGQVYLPQEISAIILKEIKRYSEKALGAEVTHAVITVPAYFGEPERAATREAGRLAGLVVKTLLPEPTAAAIAFGAQARNDRGSFVLVFDLGGGTFDISIISMVGDDFNVMEVTGDHFLGGDDFDMEIVKLILQDVQQKAGVDLNNDGRFLIVAKAEAESAKKALSSSESTMIVIPEAARPEGKVINVRMKLTRAEFERAIRPYVDRCRHLVNAALDSQSQSADLIDDVLLVGGSTAVPVVYQAMEDMFGKSKVRRDVNPMYCVAIGAGILAHRMKGVECPGCKRLCDEAEEACSQCYSSLAVARSVTEGMTVTDITANHFGIQVVSGGDAFAFRALVEKGTPLPMTEAMRSTFYTSEDEQSMIKVPVFEGLGANVLQNTKIGVIEFPLPTGMPKNHPIHIEFRLDRQSIATVIIEVEGSNIRHEQELKRVLHDEPEPSEEPSIIEDEDEASEDEKKLAVLENYIARAERFVGEYETILGEFQKRKVTEAIQRAQQVLNQDKASDALDAITNLDRLLLRCGTASLIEQARMIADSTDQASAQELLNAAELLRRAAESRDTGAEQRLSGPLASLIRQVHQQQAGVEQIGTSLTFGGLLRDQKISGGV